MKILSFCLLFYVSVLFYSCNPADNGDNGIDMNDDRGTFLVNTSEEANGLCWSADGTEIYFFADRLYAVSVVTKVVRTLDGRLSIYCFDRNLKLSNDGNTIFYINDSGYDLFSVYSIGTNGQNLKELIDSVVSTSIALSPDNNYIACSDYYHINIFKISDSTNRQYILNAHPISFSPDGSKLMCIGTGNIYQMNVSDGTNQVLFSFSDNQYGCARWETDAFKMLYNNYTDYMLWNSTSNSVTTLFTLTEPLLYYRGESALNQGCSKAVFWTHKCLKPNINWGCDATLFNLNLVNLNNLQKSIVSYFKFQGFYDIMSTYIAFSNDGTKMAYGIDKKIYMRVLQ